MCPVVSARLRMACRCSAKMIEQETVTESIPTQEKMEKMGLAPMPPPRGFQRGPAGELDYVFEPL